MKQRSTEQRSIQKEITLSLTEPKVSRDTLMVFAASHLAAIKLRDQENLSDRKDLREKLGKRLLMKNLEIDADSRLGINVFDGNLSELVDLPVLSNQQSMRYGRIYECDEQERTLMVVFNTSGGVTEGLGRGALVCSTSIANEHLTAYGVIIGYTETGAAVVYSLRDALGELRDKHFHGKEIVFFPCPDPAQDPAQSR